MLRVAVCDDEGDSRDALLEILSQCAEGQKYTVREYPDGEKLMFEYVESPQPFDLVLLDLEMPVLDGMETAVRIRGVDRDVPIIIITKHDEYTAWGYDVHAWHYLLKPVNAEKLRGALREISETRARKDKDCLVLSTGSGTFCIPFDRILYFESDRNKVNIHAAHMKKPVRVYCSLREIERMCGGDFIKSHHSFLVNIYHIENVSRKDREAVLSNGERIRVSRGKMQAVLDQIENRVYSGTRNP